MKIERYTYPDELYYDRHHAYARVEGEQTVVQGITDLGQAQVGQVFFVELPYVGRRVRQGDLLLSIQPIAMLERARRVYATVSGEIVTVNKPATKARKGINPFTKEETMFKAKPARNVVKIRPLKGLKDMV